MAKTFPDILRLADGATASFASMDTQQIRGTATQIDDLSSASLAQIGSGISGQFGKRAHGHIVVTSADTPQYYVYYGSQTGDGNISGSEWTTLTNWKEIALEGTDVSFREVSTRTVSHTGNLAFNVPTDGDVNLQANETTELQFGLGATLKLQTITDKDFHLDAKKQILLDSETNQIKAIGHITASGNISASDGFFDDVIIADDLSVVSDATIQGTVVAGNVQASNGLISAESGSFTSGSFTQLQSSTGLLISGANGNIEIVDTTDNTCNSSIKFKDNELNTNFKIDTNSGGMNINSVENRPLKMLVNNLAVSVPSEPNIICPLSPSLIS